MKKTGKKFLTAAIAGLVVAGTMITTAGAYRVSKTNVGTFEWYTYQATTTNKSNTSRLVDAYITVYEDNTGILVTTLSAKELGAYDTSAAVYNGKYQSNKYNFEIYGHVYNGGSTNSGSLWYTGMKTLD